MTYKQGEIFVANLNPTLGNEQQGIRPVVILSGNSFNTNDRIIMACPLTTKIKNYFGNPILHPNKKNGLKQTSEILIFQIRSISTSRLTKKLGNISKEQVNAIIKGLGQILTH